MAYTSELIFTIFPLVDVENSNFVKSEKSVAPLFWAGSQEYLFTSLEELPVEYSIGVEAISTDAEVIVSPLGTKKPPSVVFSVFTPSLNSIITSDEPSEKVVTVDAAAKGVKIIRRVKNSEVFTRLFTIAMLSPITIQDFYA